MNAAKAGDRARRFRVDANVGRLADVRAFVRDAVASFGGSTRASQDLVQAVDEVTCNVMLHGYDGGPGDIELEAGLRDGSIEIRILDRAPVFDPTAVRLPLPARRRAGSAGVGIQLMRAMTDAVRHHVRPGGGNELTLVRSINPTEEGVPMAMTIDVEDLGGSPAVTVVALDGELDASNYERVIEAVRDAYARGARGLVLDLSKLAFMASSGLFALHSAYRIMQGETPPDPEGGWGALHEMARDHDSPASNVRLAAPQDSIARVLERTGMAQLFPVDGDRAGAVAALQGA